MVNLEAIAGECGISPSCQYSCNAVVLKRFQDTSTAMFSGTVEFLNPAAMLSYLLIV